MRKTNLNYVRQICVRTNLKLIYFYILRTNQSQSIIYLFFLYSIFISIARSHPQLSNSINLNFLIYKNILISNLRIHMSRDRDNRRISTIIDRLERLTIEAQDLTQELRQLQSESTCHPTTAAYDQLRSSIQDWR